MGEVEDEDLFVTKGCGNGFFDDFLGEAFDNGGFADAWVTDEDRVVFGASGEDFHDAADFDFTADDGVDFAVFGVLGEVDGELF